MRHGLKTSLSTVCLAAVLFGTMSACKKKPKQPVAVSDAAVVVRNFDPDLTNRFSFARTIGKILTTAGIADTPASREALVRTMVLSFNSNQFTNPMSGLAMPIGPRGSDAGVPAADLLNPTSANGLKPIGLFNRLDLAPADWSDCGEHRIVYAGGNRMFFIFEAKLPNPDPAAGKQGCRAVAQRWHDIGTANPAQRNQLLDEFYYTGLSGFRSVVDFLNYGSFLGQVRTNILGQGPWQLREFRVLAVAPGQVAFDPAPVASNPLSSFYKDNPIGAPLEQSLRSQFQAQFASAYLNNLRNIDENEPAATTDAQFRQKLMNGLGGGFEFQFNEFQSNTQAPGEMPGATAGTAIKTAIPDNWASPVGTRTIAEAQMLNRAGALTCAGCHGLSSGQTIGTFNGAPIAWPNVASGGFVHISEAVDGSGNHLISDALASFFIPFRRAITDDVLNTTPAMLEPAGPIETAIAAVLNWLIPRASGQPAQTTGAQAMAPSRSDAERAALDLVRGRTAAPAAAREAAFAARRASALAHAREQVAPGAYVRFRRPH